jgi:hypothetical protein
MSDIGINDAATVQFVIEVDGGKHSEHVYFVDAIKVALLLREEHPESKIKVRDLSEECSLETKSELAA